MGATLVVLAFLICPSVTWQGESDTKMISVRSRRSRDRPIKATREPEEAAYQALLAEAQFSSYLPAAILCGNGAALVDLTGVEPVSAHAAIIH